MQAARVQLTKLEVELASDGLRLAAGVILLVAEVDAGVRVELAVPLLVKEALKPLATELASDKILLQIAEYDGSSENGTILQASPVSVVVVVVAVAEHPSTIEQVKLPHSDVTVLNGLAVIVVFQVEHD